MDPEANLQEMLEIANGMVNEDIDDHTASDTADLAERGQRLAELVLALDGWVSGGGFLPRSWKEGR